MTADNLHKFVVTAERYDQLVKFYNVEQLCAAKITEIKRLMPKIRTTIGTFYRFMIMDLFPDDIEKVIYLDSDIVVNLDIKMLWRMELGDKVLAAANEVEGTNLNANDYLALCREGLVKAENYFNAGVLIINLKALQKERNKIRDGFRFVAKRPQYTNFDQDILNYCFSTRTLKLSPDFNTFVVHARRRGDYRVDNRICHYISTSIGYGLTMDSRDNYNRLFMKYFAKTPWFDVDAINHLYEGTKQLYIERQSFAVKISALISGKTRAFFVSKQNVEATRNIFFVSAEEELIVETSRESLDRVMESLRASRGRKIFILLIDEYAAVYDILTQAGFVHEQDFLNGMDFLSDDNGVPLNSYSLVKLL